jgi:outer membrane protein assembly factor BamB
MTNGTIRWQVPLGSLAPGKPAVPVGAPSLGRPIVTAGGLVFIAGTLIDPSFRAFDVETGKEIWKTQLPTSGGATPITYQTRKNGKQFLVIAAGGTPWRRTAGRFIIVHAAVTDLSDVPGCRRFRTSGARHAAAAAGSNADRGTMSHPTRALSLISPAG